MNPSRKLQVLERIGRRWNDQGVTYCIAHGLEGYPQGVGRDLDVLVAPGALDEAFAGAAAEFGAAGCELAVPPPLWGRRMVGVFDRTPPFESAEVHFVPKLVWFASTLCREPVSQQRLGPFKTDPWASFTKSVLIPYLSVPRARFLARAARIPPDSAGLPLIAEELNRLLGPSLADRLRQALAAPNGPELVRLRSRIRRVITLRSFVRHPWESAANLWAKLVRTIRQGFAPCGVTAELAGGDARSRATICEQIGLRAPPLFSHRPVVIRPAPTPADRDVSKRFLVHAFARLSRHYGTDAIRLSRQQLIVYHRPEWPGEPGNPVRPSGPLGRLLERCLPQPEVLVRLDDREAPGAEPDALGGQAVPPDRKGPTRVPWVTIGTEVPPEVAADCILALAVAAFVRKNPNTNER